MIHDAYQFGAWSGILALYCLQARAGELQPVADAGKALFYRTVWLQHQHDDLDSAHTRRVYLICVAPHAN